MKFAVMPAADVRTSPSLWFCMFAIFTGTGFAQPKPKMKSISVPIGSRWRRGFRVSLPIHLAVMSPIREATHPWASS
ncbi:MAG: hypothetical protein A4E73_02291 [Syntrophaceae bacterium PtaU1.Bin231]|nr:MAG: hypothetical protein A4E73_02291 [Syntrophaceae bacterium PtaU1.Bin231]